MSAVPMREWYRRVNQVWPKEVPPLTERAARTAAKRLWRWATGNKLPFRIEYTSGRRRYTRIAYDGGLRLVVNSSRGWGHFVHDLSHVIWRHENWDARPHEKGHAQLELRMRKEVLRRGWLDGKLDASINVESKDAPPPSALDVRREKHERVLAAIERWERKLARAENALKKLRRREVGLRRHLEVAP